MFSLGMNLAHALDTTDASGLITTMVSDVGTVLVSGITTVLGVVAALIGLFFVVRLITKKIGGSK